MSTVTQFISALLGGVLALATASHGLLATAAAPLATSSPDPGGDAILARQLRVEVDPAIEDAALIPMWVVARSSHLVEGLSGRGDQEQWLAIRIEGSTYDYRVVIVAMQDGKSLGEWGPSHCECTNDELLELVDRSIAAAVESLRKPPAEQPDGGTREPPAAGAGLDPVDGDPVRRPDSSNRPRVGWLGYAGIGASAAGMGMMAGGIPLALRHDQIRGEPGELMTRSTRNAGVGLALAGGATLAVGLSVLIIDAVRSRRRVVTVIPSIDRDQHGVAITWRR